MSLKTSLIITGDSGAAKAAVDALKDSVDKLNETAKAGSAPADAMGKAVDGVADSAKDAADALGSLDGAIGDIAGSAADAAGTGSALGGALDDIGTGARNAGKDAGFLGSILSDASGAIKDAISGALGLDGALDNMGGATKESSKLAGELEGKLGDMAKGALESSAAQGAIAKASGVAATAMSGFGVSAATVEAILTGGLSLALTAVIGFMSGFAAEALSGSDALGQQEDAAASLTEQIDALNDALAREIKTQYASEMAALANAEAHRTLAIEAVKSRKALLETAIAEQKKTPSWAPAGPGQAIQQAALMSANAAVADLRKELAAAESDLAAREKEVVAKRRPFVDRGIAAATDPRARINLNYDRSLFSLDRRRDDLSEAEYSRQKIKLDNERKAALDAVSEAEKKASASGKTLSSTRSATSAADRAAAEATKKLKADLEGVIGRYDPARKAAADYAEELERIAKLKDAGKISDDDATNYRAQASAAYLSKSLDVSGIKELAEQEQAAIDASGAIDKIVQSINDETAALGVLNPVQRELLNYREQLAALSPEERAAAEARISGALAEKAATEEVARATEEARRAQEQLGNMAVDAFAAIVAGGQKADDVIGRLAETIASAALQATLFGTGPLAAMLNGAVAPSTGSNSQSAVSDQANKALAKTLSGEIETSMDKVFGTKGSFGKTLQNAGLGYAAGGITGSKTGGALGGMIGGAVGKELLGSALGSLGQFAGPIGAIAGGLLGGAIGGLLKKTKTGAANITSVDSDATLSGNSSQFKAAASGAASSVQDGLSSIAEQLGGSIGSFNVTIGQRHGDWRVRSGTGSLKVAKGAKEFDDDQEGAIAYAMQLAISQGAVTGLSAAVAKALNSSTDLDEALTEALKVQEIETLLGGITAEMTNQFKTFEAQAKERLRIATEYGFDIVEIEKKNAEDRAALVDQILSSRIGSLQDLLDDLKFGDLYEGSVADQRTALLAEIAKARAAAEAGEDGAADTLATLSRQLIELSREAYGTAGGEYLTDRDSAIADAQAVIKAETDRVTAAQEAAGSTNEKLDEANDIAATSAASLEDISSKLSTLIDAVSTGASALTVDTSLVAIGR